MRKIHELLGDSSLVGRLPHGCVLCAKGAKIILFVTGRCLATCFYCPLSKEKKQKDVMFVDEIPISSDEDVIHEAKAINAEGAGISGGDPLVRLEKTLHFIRLLKENRGSTFHIHLYTAQTNVKKSILKSLYDAGLDEIRFHPQNSNWSGIKSAVELGLSVGLELPVIPRTELKLQQIIVRAENIGVKFVNLNELEASETNFRQLLKRGFSLKDLSGASIKGSDLTAIKVLNWGSKYLKHISLHYCTARFKDAIQMRNRLWRRLRNTRRCFEEVDDSEPLLILGVIRAPSGKYLDLNTLKNIFSLLKTRFNVPNELMNFDTFRHRIEIAPWILQELSTDLKNLLDTYPAIEMGIAYEYPSWDRFQTLFNPL